VLRVIAQHGGRDLEHAYDQAAACTFLAPAAAEAALTRGLADATRGTVVPERLGTAVILT
jgi:hypothetical protein